MTCGMAGATRGPATRGPAPRHPLE